ncbi:MAG TPA: hypothetical protein VFJ89_11940 [Nocardioides sp.]|nr:hypothetical protein [Nocardioides sp.]
MTITRAAVATLAALALTSVGAAADAHPGHGHHGSRAERDPSVRVLKALGHLDRHLAHATRDGRLSRLTADDSAALQANAAADQAAVTAAADAYSTDPGAASLAAAKVVLRTYRPRVYVVATNLLRHDERLTVEIADLQPLVTPGSTDETDLATASGLLDGVAASAFTATTDGATVRAAQHAVAQAQALVDQVAADVAAG